MGRFMPEPVDPSNPDNEWSNKWSTSVGELRAALEGIDDDYEVVLENADVDDLDIAELTITHLFPPTPQGNAGLVVLSQGQIISSAYDYDVRLGAHLHSLDGAGVKNWDETTRTWQNQHVPD